MRHCVRFLVVGLACVLVPVVAVADPGDLLRIFENPNPGFSDYFGASMAVSGDKVLIGAPYAFGETGEVREGAAYLFDGNTGELLRTFLSPEPSGTPQHFGSSVATVGENFLIGGPTGTTVDPVSAAYLFDGSTGELLQTFRDPVTSGPIFDYFGSPVTVLGENILVGDSSESASDYRAGAVYLFDALSGELQRTFSNPHPDQELLFGHAVAAVGSNVLVGTPGDDPIGGAGRAYLFDGSSGELLLTLNDGTYDPDTGEGWSYDGDHFGRTVAAYGDDFLVAGHSYSDSERAGVFLFDGTSGEILNRFMYPGFDESDGFGLSITVVGDDVLVGAAGSGSGKGGYLFDGGTGDLLLTIPDPGVGTFFGTAFGAPVASFGRDILIAAQGDDSAGQDFGRVYLFQGVPEPSTFALLAMGAAVGLIATWRSRRRAARRQMG